MSEMKHYRIADVNIGMQTFGVTELKSRPWQISVPGCVDFELSAAPFLINGDLPAEEESAKEYALTELQFSKNLLDYNGFILHASAIAFNGKAYCFCAPSGTGKSTHASLWQRKFGEDRVLLINDDKPALRLVNDRWFVYGTPWSGKTNLSMNISRELGGIFVLARAAANQIRVLTAMQKVRFMASFISGPMSGIERGKALALLDRLIASVPILQLDCLPDEGAVDTAYQAILNEEKQRG